MGKASGSVDIADDIKSLKASTSTLHGLNRHNSNSTKNIITTKSPAENSNFESKLSVQGGIIKGSLGFKKTTTTALTSSGIIDLLVYNTTRLVITNTSGYTLKVLNPVLGDGQVIFIRAVDGQVVNIQNTSGTGDLVTGNIETLAGTTYALSGDDWIGLFYDYLDLKWHQFTVGKLNIGSATGGEVFIWSASHSANNQNLNNINALQFNIDTSNDGRIQAPAGIGMQYVVDSNTLSHGFWIVGIKWYLSNNDAELYNSTNGELRLYNNNTEEYSFGRLFADFHGNDLFNCGTINAEAAASIKLGDTSVAGMIQARGSTECGFAVSNSVITIGSRGTIQIPTDTNTGATITDSANLDSLFGDDEGCIGITGLRGTSTPIFWVRRADGSTPQWRGAFLSVSST